MKNPQEVASTEMKILTVDDDPVFLEVMKIELAALGQKDVRQAQSAAEAMRLVRKSAEPFDCVFLDVMMPETDGVELCAMLRKEPATKSAPIIMVTVQTEIENVDRAFAAGATDYLNKPLNPRELRGRLQMVQSLARGAAARTQEAGRPRPDISDPLPLEGVTAGVSYLAMQNYLLKLRTMKLFSRIAVGVRIANIEAIHKGKTASDFHGVILDVAEVISEAFRDGPKMICHAGGGDFVVLLNRIMGFNREAVVDALAVKMSELSELYARTGEKVPVLGVGPAVAPGLMLFHPADELLTMAIEEARENGVTVTYGTGQPGGRTRRAGLGA